MHFKIKPRLDQETPSIVLALLVQAFPRRVSLCAPLLPAHLKRSLIPYAMFYHHRHDYLTIITERLEREPANSTVYSDYHSFG